MKQYKIDFGDRLLILGVIRYLEVGPGLSEAQFAFRAGWPTVDALNVLKAWSLVASAERDVFLAVSLDAFNNLPFGYHEVPFYLRRPLDNYLQDRVVVWIGGYGQIGRRSVDCGVLLGSELGSILWSIGYNWLLRGRLPLGMSIICYADTLVTARGPSYQDAARFG